MARPGASSCAHKDVLFLADAETPRDSPTNALRRKSSEKAAGSDRRARASTACRACWASASVVGSGSYGLGVPAMATDGLRSGPGGSAASKVVMTPSGSMSSSPAQPVQLRCKRGDPRWISPPGGEARAGPCATPYGRRQDVSRVPLQIGPCPSGHMTVRRVTRPQDCSIIGTGDHRYPSGLTINRSSRPRQPVGSGTRR
jgi:hypothetical protein